MSKLTDKIEIDCPYCNMGIKITVKRINQSVTCPLCKQSFEVEDDGLLDELDDAEEMIDDFLNNISF